MRGSRFGRAAGRATLKTGRLTRLLVIGGAVVVVGGGAAIAIVATSSSSNPSATATTPAVATAPATSAPAGDGGGTATDPVATSAATSGPTSAPTSAPPPPAPVTISSGPCASTGCNTSSARATFEFSSLGASAYECSVDGGGFSSCTSPHAVATRAGQHRFQARVAGLNATVSSFVWTVAQDASIDTTAVTNGITAHSTGHACGGTRGPWEMDIAFHGSAVSETFHLRFQFPPGSTLAPVDGDADIPPINGIVVHVTIHDGLLVSRATGGGFTGVARARVVAKLAGTEQHPRIKFVQTQLSGTVSGAGAVAPFSTAGGTLGYPVHLARFAGCP